MNKCFPCEIDYVVVMLLVVRMCYRNLYKIYTVDNGYSDIMDIVIMDIVIYWI